MSRIKSAVEGSQDDPQSFKSRLGRFYGRKATADMGAFAIARDFLRFATPMLTHEPPLTTWPIEITVRPVPARFVPRIIAKNLQQVLPAIVQRMLNCFSTGNADSLRSLADAVEAIQTKKPIDPLRFWIDAIVGPNENLPTFSQFAAFLKAQGHTFSERAIRRALKDRGKDFTPGPKGAPKGKRHITVHRACN